MSNTVYLERKDETVDAIVRAAFPGYTGKKIEAVMTDRVRFSGTQWDEGNKNEYVVLTLADLKSATIPTAPFMRQSADHETDVEIPVGYVVVCHCIGRYDHIVIYTRPENITKMLPAPVELTEDERIVLTATRSLKSSYAGIKEYRFHEARRRRGITRDRWDAAKASLIGKRFLNAAGAITTNGRNAVPGFPQL
jgi:hypothetical protein